MLVMGSAKVSLSFSQRRKRSLIVIALIGFLAYLFSLSVKGINTVPEDSLDHRCFEVENAYGDEHTSSGWFSIGIRPAHQEDLGKDEEVTVNVGMTSGTAIVGTDFEPWVGTVTINKGSAFFFIQVPFTTIYNDAEYEGFETFYVTLSNPIGLSICPGSESFEALLYDDDRPISTPTPTPIPPFTPTPTPPYPVVLVHGLADTFEGWNSYLGDNGFLASIERQGFAANNLDTGGGKPIGEQIGWTTNTIDENAMLLGEFIANVTNSTGVEKVDIVAHSMGGLIARSYIAHHMSKPNVNQLIMLGTPNGGSYTVEAVIIGVIGAGGPLGLGVALIGWNYPAVLELTPLYLSWWNLNNSDQKGVPFYAIAGNLGIPPDGCEKQNPLEPKPNDIIVASSSVFAIPLNGAWTFPGDIGGCSGFHTGMRSFSSSLFEGGPHIFSQYVKPRLIESASLSYNLPSGNKAYKTDKINFESNLLQYGNVVSDTLKPDKTLQFTWTISAVSSTNFSVIGYLSQMAVKLRDPDGIIITPTSSDPLIQYNTIPEDIFPLATYSISSPKEGLWTMLVDATDVTPSDGTVVIGLISMTGSSLILEPFIPLKSNEINQPVIVTAKLSVNEMVLTGASVSVKLINPDDTTTILDLYDDGQHADGSKDDGVYSNQFMPTISGVYGGVITSVGSYLGQPFTRSSVWVAEVDNQKTNIYLPLVSK